MGFKQDVPNWKAYDNEKYKMNVVPESAYSELNGIILRAAHNANELKAILNGMAEIIPCEPTQNWGWDFLAHDVSGVIDSIASKVDKGRFPVFMDCLSVLVNPGDLLLDDINDFLEDNEIGYRAEYNFNHHIEWKVVQESHILNELDDTQKCISSISEQAFDEIRRARKSLEDTDDERAIKDALRSVLSAMEAVVKELGNDNEIANATKNLKAQGSWGKDEIVKEGHSIFNTMHRLYPDLRHGSLETSSLSLNEAEYWIGRILNFIQYLDRQKKNIDSSNLF